MRKGGWLEWLEWLEAGTGDYEEPSWRLEAMGSLLVAASAVARREAHPASTSSYLHPDEHFQGPEVIAPEGGAPRRSASIQQSAARAANTPHLHPPPTRGTLSPPPAPPRPLRPPRPALHHCVHPPARPRLVRRPARWPSTADATRPRIPIPPSPQ